MPRVMNYCYLFYEEKISYLFPDLKSQMSRYSDSSDSDVSYKKSKKKKHKRSRSRSRSKSARKRKSRSRSREKRRHRSRSRDRKRSRSRDRRRSRSRTKSRDRRRSRSRDRRRSRSSSRGHRRSRARTRSHSRSESRDTSRHHPAKRASDSDNDVEIVEDKGRHIVDYYIPFSNSIDGETEFPGLNPSEMMMTISDQLKRARAISDIESDSFKQQVCHFRFINRNISILTLYSASYFC